MLSRLILGSILVIAGSVIVGGLLEAGTTLVGLQSTVAAVSGFGLLLLVPAFIALWMWVVYKLVLEMTK